MPSLEDDHAHVTDAQNAVENFESSRVEEKVLKAQVEKLEAEKQAWSEDKLILEEDKVALEETNEGLEETCAVLGDQIEQLEATVLALNEALRNAGAEGVNPSSRLPNEGSQPANSTSTTGDSLDPSMNGKSTSLEGFPAFAVAERIKRILLALRPVELLTEWRRAEARLNNKFGYIADYAWIFRQVMRGQEDADLLTDDERRQVDQTDQCRRSWIDTASRCSLLKAGWSDSFKANRQRYQVGDIVTIIVIEKMHDQKIDPSDACYMSSNGDIYIIRQYPHMLIRRKIYGWEVLRIETRRGKGRQDMPLRTTVRVVSVSSNASPTSPATTADDAEGPGPIDIIGQFCPDVNAIVDLTKTYHITADRMMYPINGRATIAAGLKIADALSGPKSDENKFRRIYPELRNLNDNIGRVDDSTFVADTSRFAVMPQRPEGRTFTPSGFPGNNRAMNPVPSFGGGLASFTPNNRVHAPAGLSSNIGGLQGVETAPRPRAATTADNQVVPEATNHDFQERAPHRQLSLPDDMIHIHESPSSQSLIEVDNNPQSLKRDRDDYARHGRGTKRLKESK
ncbi:hypothetical protein LTR56_001132 [Elasticomyces elasticus]|nr:hypothetical protein LTR56_001132 [Elasticomyces elasticus]KAK3663532.1 hypothetical protein LTR22_005704 [Elasticomyces elasticus]KAK4927081.1 hypothetical protein LTR49_005996 [Elasticomyces elasticus]KAK5769053.1 hypothetical protein LTS12_000767 [Elasticomyces elasticus]